MNHELIYFSLLGLFFPLSIYTHAYQGVALLWASVIYTSNLAAFNGSQSTIPKQQVLGIRDALLDKGTYWSMRTSKEVFAIQTDISSFMQVLRNNLVSIILPIFLLLYGAWAIGWLYSILLLIPLWSIGAHIGVFIANRDPMFIRRRILNNVSNYQLLKLNLRSFF